jgi:hypothetical protein
VLAGLAAEPGGGGAEPVADGLRDVRALPAGFPHRAVPAPWLVAEVPEAEREGWLGEAEGLRVSLAAARDKLAQLDERTRRAATVSLGIPAYRDIAARTATVPGNLP